MAETELSAGTYTIEVTNEGQASHDLVVEGPDGEDVAATEILPPGASGTVEVTLEPGEYVFYCSVGPHRGMGMELPVTVL
jgi:plastocyanin